MVLQHFLSFIAIFVACTSVKALPSAPEWGEWSGWTPCSLQCGAGVSSQNRSCLANCQKDKTTEKRFRSCCVQDCPASYASSENRCSKLPGSWIEAPSETFGCSILCVNQTENSATTARKEVQLQSGTPCQTEEGRKGICLDNICAVVGCDNILGSSERRNKCFQCSSTSNAECRKINDSLSNQLSPILRSIGRVTVLHIPIQSSFLRISHPLEVSGTRLALQSSGQVIFLGGRNGTRFQAAGSHFTYFLYSTVEGDREELRANGPTNSSIVVQLLFTTSEPTPTIEYRLQYSYHHLNGPTSAPGGYDNSSAHAHCGSSSSQEPVHRDYRWGYEEPSPCSVTCGRGTQTLLPRCIDKLYPWRQLSEELCLKEGLVKPAPIVQLCQVQDCPPVWKNSEWSSCLGQCGGESIQTRLVHCERFVQEGSDPVILTDQTACGLDNKPAVQQSCNRTDCVFSWITEDWSPCSELITENLQHRSVNCQQVGTESSVDPAFCDATTRPTSVRTCRSKNCINGRCCAWRPRSWGKCNMGCGFGQQSRVLECRYTNDLSPADKSCCAGVVQPPMQRECWSTEEQNCSAFWDMGEFGKCAGRCCSNNQFQTRTVKCSVQTQPGQTVVLPDEACHTVPKPATNIICKRTDCPKWIVSDWGSCSPPDHQDCGYRTRSVRCMLDGEEAADCCEEQPIQAQPCLPCDPPTTEPPHETCEDLFGGFCTTLSSCDIYKRLFCCKTCRNLPSF